MVSQEEQPGGHLPAEELDGVEEVAGRLNEGPADDHETESPVLLGDGGDVGEAPQDGKAGEHLDKSGEERRMDPTDDAVDDLKDGNGLDDLERDADDAPEVGRGVKSDGKSEVKDVDPSNEASDVITKQVGYGMVV